MGLFKKKQDYTYYEADDYYPDASYQQEDPVSYQHKRPKHDSYYEKEYKDIAVEKKVRFTTNILLFLGVYLAFVVIGIFSTSYMQDEFGEKRPQIITLEMRAGRESYAQLKNQYLLLNELLLDIQQLDKEFVYNLNQDNDNSFVLATEYQALLPRIDSQLPKVKAMAIQSKYDSMKSQLTEAYMHTSYYLQKIAKALSEKDQEVLLDAVSWSVSAYSDFAQFRKNMGEFAKLVKLDDKDVLYGDPLQSIFAHKELQAPE